MKPVTIGLLPLYLKLYDDTSPQHRAEIERFLHVIADALRTRDIQVVTAPVCRIEPEFASAISDFENADVDAIVTLHLAYSPSEESAAALAATRLPIIVLDTTPDYDFSSGQSADRIMFNHGIHGVQDMCNLLIRKGKQFAIEAGHWEHDDVLDRVTDWARAAHIAAALRTARVGRIGNPFRGMGDFALPDEVLRSVLGVTVIPTEPSAIGERLELISNDDVRAEVDVNLGRFLLHDVSDEAHWRSVRLGLAVRQWIDENRLSAWTINFMEANRDVGMPTMPFLEASVGMARGIGYAGEGDALTAAFIGALAQGFAEVSFTEMFCPDWEHSSIFLSHMGEMNTALIAGMPRLVQKPYAFIAVDDPVLAVGCFKPGEAVFVNLAPGPGDTFSLIIAPVTVLDAHNAVSMSDSIHGWIKPALPLPEFLQRYSKAGGIHHAALVYGDVSDTLCRFGHIMNWTIEVLQ